MLTTLLEGFPTNVEEGKAIFQQMLKKARRFCNGGFYLQDIPVKPVYFQVGLSKYLSVSVLISF